MLETLYSPYKYYYASFLPFFLGRLNSIHMVVNQMAWKRRAVYNMMSRERKQRLEEYMKLRMSKVSRGVQTEESLIDRRSLPFIRQQEIFPRLETSL